MPVCPAVSSHLYTVSSLGKRLVHADTCANISAIITDTDGQVRCAGFQGSSG